MGLAGLFGRGPLAHATAGSPRDPIHVEYDRFARFQCPAKLKVFATAAAVQNGQLVLPMSRELAETLQLNRTSPPPLSVQADTGGLVLTFSVAVDLGKSAIIFSQNPDKFGRIPGRIADGAGQTVAFEQIVYP